MKNLILLSIVLLSFSSCRKNYCETLVTPWGEPCCVKCFRSQEKYFEFTKENFGKDLCEFCK